MIIHLKVTTATYEDNACYRAVITLRPFVRVDREGLLCDIAEISGILDQSESDRKEL